MAKYDEFGRPIYETAEEYNRAHKTGGSSRVYRSPEGDTYEHTSMKKAYGTSGATRRKTKGKGLKKSSLIIIGVAIYFSIMIVLTAFNMLRSSFGGVYEEFEENLVEIEPDVPEDYGEYIGEDTSPLPEDFATFSYNGQTYSLPTTMTEIMEMGFTLEEEYDEWYMVPPEQEETLILNGEDGFMYGMISISNYTDEDLPLMDCTVHYFFIENPGVDYTETEMLFTFGDGLTFESSYEDLEAYFGVPYYHYEDHAEEDNFYDSYDWSYYGEDEIHFVSVSFWNGEIMDIGIEKRVVEE